MKASKTSVSALALLAALAISQPVMAQATDEGAWFAWAANGPLSTEDPGTRFRWWFDGHARFFDESNGFDTSIVRPGLGYKLTENATAWLGYAWIRNDPVSGGFDEQRIWQQFTWSKKYDWGRPFLRTRLEQRFDDRGGDVGWRLRQFVRWTHPVCEGSRLGFRVWDEVFFDLNNTSWGQDTGFRQNRAFAGLGWQLDDAGKHTLEFGYLNQHIWRDNARDDSNHILAITLLSNF